MPVYPYSILGLVQQLTNLTAAPSPSLKVICSCEVPVSFFLWTLPSLIPLPYNPCLGNLMDREALGAAVHGVTKESNRTYWLNNNSLTCPPRLSTCCSHAKLTQKDNADSGVQFITPARPRQSLLLAKDPDQFLWKPYIPQVYVPKPTSLNSLKLVWTKEKKDTIKVNLWSVCLKPR